MYSRGRICNLGFSGGICFGKKPMAPTLAVRPQPPWNHHHFQEADSCPAPSFGAHFSLGRGGGREKPQPQRAPFGRGKLSAKKPSPKAGWDPYWFRCLQGPEEGGDGGWVGWCVKRTALYSKPPVKIGGELFSFLGEEVCIFWGTMWNSCMECRYACLWVYIIYYISTLCSTESFTRWFKPWPFHPGFRWRSRLQPLKRVTWTHHPKKVTFTEFARYMDLTKGHLVGGWTNPLEKYYIVKLDHFPR